jgi:hypothetical protein
MKIFYKVFLIQFVFIVLATAQTKFIINDGTGLYIPMNSVFCADSIVVNSGGSYITADPSGTCPAASVSGEGEIVFPVELTSFYGKESSNKIVLYWTTATEVNNFGFEVQRKNYGSEFWSQIGFVNGNGNSNSPKSYSFTDNSTAIGTIFFYRLKQFDTDGAFHYSDSIEVALKNLNYSLNQNFPNPFNPSTIIEFSIPEDAEGAKLTIYDTLGQEVTVLLNGKIEAGRYQYLWNASGNSSGLYIYRLETDKFNSIKKMILLK